jgi:endonuclease YncB( thermonuclease family)
MYLWSSIKSFFEQSLTCFSVERPLWLPIFSMVVLCILLVGVVSPVEGLGSGKSHGFNAKVLWVIDGDSVEVSRHGAKSTIRLYGIDTPEWKQPYSNLAKEYLQKEIAGERVEIVPFYRDTYGRTIAIVKHKSKNLNEVLVEKGFAWVHVYYCKKPICAQWKKLERDARISRRGLWRQANPVPPWVWKREQ